MTPGARAALGISEGFFRVSVGVEDVELLLRDFTAGVAAAKDA
jgi:cystathionine gamma-synthase